MTPVPNGACIGIPAGPPFLSAATQRADPHHDGVQDTIRQFFISPANTHPRTKSPRENSSDSISPELRVHHR